MVNNISASSHLPNFEHWMMILCRGVAANNRCWPFMMSFRSPKWTICEGRISPRGRLNEHSPRTYNSDDSVYEGTRARGGVGDENCCHLNVDVGKLKASQKLTYMYTPFSIHNSFLNLNFCIGRQVAANHSS